MNYTGSSMMHPDRIKDIVQDIVSIRLRDTENEVAIEFPRGFSLVEVPDPRVEVHYGVDSIDVMAEEFIVCRLCFAKRREGSDFFVFEERESVWFSCEEHKVDYAEEDACKHECSDLKRHIQIDREYHENPDRLKYSAADWSPESIAKFVAEHKECYNS